MNIQHYTYRVTWATISLIAKEKQATSLSVNLLIGAFRLFKLALVFLTCSQSVLAASPMQFSEHDPCGGGNSYECRSFILAKGEITAQTAQQFRKFVLAREGSWKATIYFDSLGGNLGAGIELGRAIREFGYDTFVGDIYRDWLTFTKDGRIESSERVLSLRPVCASACTYAFLGGKQRKLDDNARLGVHQFRSTSGDTGESSAQSTLSIVSRYVREMGVNLGILELASSTSSDNILWVRRDEAMKLNVDNSNPKLAEWAIKALTDGRATLGLAHTIDPGRTVVISLGKTKITREVIVILTLTSDVPLEIREATLAAITSNEITLRLVADNKEIDVVERINLEQTSPLGPGTRTYAGGFLTTARGFAQLKLAKTLRLDANTPGHLRPAQFWSVLSTTGLNTGMLLVER